MDEIRREPIAIAWNDHVAAFEAIAVLIGEHVAHGLPPKEAFLLVWDQVSVPEEFRDKYWRVALPVLAEHALRNGERPDLTGLDLSAIDFAEGDLRGFDLRGANLRGADLEGALLDGADLTGADLTGATMQIGRAHV